MKRLNEGFTLIELMIVVVVLGILAAIAIPKFSEVSKRGKEAEAGPILKQLYTLQERHVQQHGFYATDLSQLEGGAANFTGRYYNFQLSADAEGAAYVACAAPGSADWGLRPFRVDQNASVGEGTC